MFTINQIVEFTRAKRSGVELMWPKVARCMQDFDVFTRECQIAAIATIVVETAGTFMPIHEYGSEKYLNDHYDTRTDLGNTPERDGDGALYCGRGLAQLTGKENYILAGNELGIDLVHHPERANEPDVAASVFVWFFVRKHMAAAANKRDWERVRRVWNGGLNGWPDFIKVVHQLEEIPT